MTTCRACDRPLPAAAFGSVPGTCKACVARRARDRRAADRPTYPTGTHPCTGCGEVLPVAAFEKRRSRGWRCRSCITASGRARMRDRTGPKTEAEKAYYAEWRRQNPERVAALNADWKEANRDRIREYGRNWNREVGRFRRHGISKVEFDVLWLEQLGACAICREPLDITRTAIDHDHACCAQSAQSCGRCIRGLLCSPCNGALGLFRDDRERIATALEYLARPRYQPQHIYDRGGFVRPGAIAVNTSGSPERIAVRERGELP